MERDETITFKSEFKNSLQNISLSKYLNSQELEMLWTHSKIVTFSEGKTILQQGKESKGIYLILRGNVIISAKIFGHRSANLERLGPGSFLGESCFVERGLCTTSIIADEEVQCLLIENVYIDLLSTFFPETKHKLFVVIAEQIRDHLKKIHDKIVDFISTSQMVPRSLFGEIIQSFTKSTEISFLQGEISPEKLKKLIFFQNFTSEEIDKMLALGVLVNAPKNCTLIHKGTTEASCYIVLNGAIQSSIVHNNKVAKLSVIGPITLFASIACIDNQSPFTITFTTCEQAVLIKFDEPALHNLQKNNIVIWYKIFDLICKSLIALEKSVDKLDIRLNIESYNR